MSVPHGFYKDDVNKLLLPQMMPVGKNAVPEQVLKMFHCNCASDEPCSTNRCLCGGNKLSCSVFCACNGNCCYNVWTVNENDTGDGDGDDDEEEDAEED